MNIGPRHIAERLATQPVDDLWRHFHAHVQTLQPFWISCVTAFAQLSAVDDGKRDAYLDAAKGAFDRMDDWRFRRVKYIKARRNEIDSAISLIRNKALEHPIRTLRCAAAARNAASALRVLLTVSCHGYRDAQIPELVAISLYDIAAVRTLLPFDFGTLMCFHPGHSAVRDGDPFLLMLERAQKETSMSSPFEALLREAAMLWQNFEAPQPIVPDGQWFGPGDGVNAQLYHTASKAFHSRS